MECLKYINDLKLEIQMLEDLKNDINSNEINKKINEKMEIISKCKTNLDKLSNEKVEYKLYLCLLNNMSPTQAVEKVANDNYINDIKPTSTQAIWRIYTKMKNFLKQEWIESEMFDILKMW